jgi:hypothetical protein
MQELDEQVSSARAVAKKGADFGQGAVVEGPTLGPAIAAAPFLYFHSHSHMRDAQTRLE